MVELHHQAELYTIQCNEINLGKLIENGSVQTRHQSNYESEANCKNAFQIPDAFHPLLMGICEYIFC